MAQHDAAGPAVAAENHLTAPQVSPQRSSERSRRFGCQPLSDDPEVKAGLMANTERAHARGAFGSPTFFVGDDIYFGKDRLREVEEAIAQLR